MSVPRAVHEIVEPRALAALESGLRQRVVDALAAAGPMTAGQLARRLGRRPDSLYYHLRALEKVGLVGRAGRARTGGRDGDVFATPSREMRIPPDTGSPHVARHLPRITNALLELTRRDVARAFATGAGRISGASPNLWVSRMETALPPRRLAELRRRVRALGEWMQSVATEEGERCAFVLVLAPLELPRARGRKSVARPGTARRRKPS